MKSFRRFFFKISLVPWYLYTGGDKVSIAEYIRRCLHRHHPFTGPKEVQHNYVVRKCVHWGCNHVDVNIDQDEPEHYLLKQIAWYDNVIELITSPPGLSGLRHKVDEYRKMRDGYRERLEKIYAAMRETKKWDGPGQYYMTTLGGVTITRRRHELVLASNYRTYSVRLDDNTTLAREIRKAQASFPEVKEIMELDPEKFTDVQLRIND